MAFFPPSWTGLVTGCVFFLFFFLQSRGADALSTRTVLGGGGTKWGRVGGREQEEEGTGAVNPTWIQSGGGRVEEVEAEVPLLSVGVN